MFPENFRKYVSIFVFLVYVQYSFQNPMKDPKICGRPTCKEPKMFKYGPATQQDYRYTVEVRSLFNGTSKNESSLYVEGVANLSFLTPCDGILTLSDIKLSEYIPRDDYESSDHANTEQFSSEITENSLRFSFNDGIISELCPSDDEKSWVLNFKRGILSMLQNSMKRFDVDHRDILEEDVRGKCLTTYTVIGAKETSLMIEKTKDLNSCRTRGKLHSAVQSVPYSSQPGINEYNILKSTSHCEMAVDNNIYKEISCRESHIFRPLSNKQAGATTSIVQKLTLINDSPGYQQELDNQPEINVRSSLHFDHTLTERTASVKLKESRDLIKDLCQQDPDDIKFQMSDLFSKFIRTLKTLPFTALKPLYGHTGRVCKSGQKIFLDALPFIGTSASVMLMKEIILKRSIPESTINEWVLSISFTSKPDEGMIEASARLLEEQTFSPNIALSVSALTHTYCKLYSDCSSHDPVLSIVQYLQNEVRNFYGDYSESDRKVQENLIISLKALSNVGVIVDNFEEDLHRIIADKSIDLSVRLAAIEAFRRLSCEDNREYFEDLYKNQDEDVEIRISAYLMFMKCPSYITIRTVRDSLAREEVNQVGSFVWTHLSNLLKSSIPSRVEIQSILSESDLSKKFDTDVRKFSHNREGSLYFEDFRAGASYENNIIFSPSSYVPRSAMLNLTVNLFGESINLLEVNGRTEGFEQYFESLFGPKGSSRNITDKLPFPKLRWTRDANEDKAIVNSIGDIPNIRDNFNEDPKVFLGFKIFGNELKYSSLRGMSEIREALGKLNPVQQLKDILSGKEIAYNKAVMFLDSSYIVASGAGLPIALNAVGTASIDIKLFGSLKADNFMKNKELDITINVKPSISLDISGEMAVNAFYARTGIRLKTNVYTASAVETFVKLRGSQLVSVKCTLPRQNTEIIGARSELLIKQNGIEQAQSGFLRNRVSESICYWPVVDKAVGLKPCGDYHFVNVTKINNAPYFLLAGPAGFRWYLNKSDPTAKIYLFEYKKTASKDLTVYTVILDTPGSASKTLLAANLTLDTKTQNVIMQIHSSDGNLLARGKYKNTDNEKLLEMSLDINNQKHFDTTMSLSKSEIKNGFIYYPKIYIGVNNDRVVDVAGQIELLSKKDISQYTVDLKFHTKRMTSSLFGYISKTEHSIATSLQLDYKFQHTKKHRVVLEFSGADDSKRNIVIYRGDCKLHSSAYPNFNFDSNVTLYKTENHLDINATLTQNPLTENDPDAEEQTLRFNFGFSDKYIENKRTIHGDFKVKRPSSKLDVRGVVNYERFIGDIKLGVSVNSNGKEVAVNALWSRPRTTLEQIKAHLNITVPSFAPMVLQIDLEEKISGSYYVMFNGTWFSGHSVLAKGKYQDKSTPFIADYHIKFTAESPDFKILAANLQYLKSNDLLRFNLTANYDENNYTFYLNHEKISDQELSTNAVVQYQKKTYTLQSMIYDGEYRKVVVELRLDQLRDIHFSTWLYNQESYKALGFDLKWDANRDPNQKLMVMANFTQISKYNQVADLIISYPGRTIGGKYEFLLEKSKIDALVSISWDVDKTMGIDFLLLYDDGVDLNVKIYTTVEPYRMIKIIGKYSHKDNLYALTGGITWDHRQKIMLEFHGNYFKNPPDIQSYDYKFSLESTLRNIPSIATIVKHYQNSSTYNTNLHFMYNPEYVIDVNSVWKIVKDNSHKTLAGTVIFRTPLKGINNGILESKIYLVDHKYIRGFGDLKADNKKIIVNLEGRFKKVTNSMLILNITADDEDYQARFILSEENRHLVAQVIYPNGTLGTELLLQMQTLNNFDIRFTLATPISFLKDFMIIGKLKQGEADFRLGWNFLVVGFSGVWHYANVTDFEYTYKIYTPIEDFEENGVVAKLIFKEGLDFEVSIKLSSYKLGLKLLGQPKSRPLKELGINVKEIYAGRLSDLNDNLGEKEPISWKGLIEVNVVAYPTMKGEIDIDQKGPVYYLQTKIILPNGEAKLMDEFEYIDILSMSNKLDIRTPYPTFNKIVSNFNLRVKKSELYHVFLNLNYFNRSKLIETELYAKYEAKKLDEYEVLYNTTLKIHTPFQALRKLDLSAEYETEENFYRTSLTANTLENSVEIDLTSETVSQLTETVGNLRVKTPVITIPPCHLVVKRNFTDADNLVEVHINMPDVLKKEIYFQSSWLIKSKTQFRGMIQVETPFGGVENMSGGVNVHIGESKSNIWARIYLHPITADVSSSLIDNDLQMNSTLQINDKRFPINVNCKMIPQSDDIKLLNGTLLLKDTLFKINGTLQFQSKIPVNVLIHLIPLDGADTLKFQYQLKPATDGYELAGTMRRSDKLTEFNVYATGNNTFNWEFKLKVKTPNKERYDISGKSLSTENTKNVQFNVTTPIRKLENPKFGLSLITNGLKNTVNGYYELTQSKGDMHINIIWVLLENMYIKAIGNFENDIIKRTSHLEAIYKNPNKEYKLLQIGADVNLDKVWEGGSNVTLNIPISTNISLDAHIKLPNPNQDVHSVSGNLSYGRKFKHIYYLGQYRTSATRRKYGSKGEINVSNEEDLKGDIEIEWDGKCFNNYANLKRPKGIVDLIYKLKTPKYRDQNLFVGLFKFKTLGDRYNISGEAFYPEKRSVAVTAVNYKELGNMKGMFNITVPYKGINYTGAFFDTLTSESAYNRYVKVFWNNESATLDGICNIVKGSGKEDSMTKGKLNITIPLTTRHNVDVDFIYNKEEASSVGDANVIYNGEKVLVGKYNSVVEKGEYFNKKTIHVELENNKVPIGADYVHGTEYSKSEMAEKATRDRFNAPTVVDDHKYLHVYDLKNASKLNLTGMLNVSSSETGQKYVIAATHLNRTVKLWMGYDVLNKQYKQHSRLELSPNHWIQYDLDLLNRTVDETFDAQQIQINVSYPRRNFTAQSFYNISDSIVSTDVFLVWDKDNKKVEAELDWVKVSPQKDQIELLLKHSSFPRDVSFFSEYGYNDTSVDVGLVINYSDNPDQQLTINGSLSDKSDRVTTNYTYNLEAEHILTSLSLKSWGDLYWNNKGYGTEHYTYYKRSYLPLSVAETFGKVDFTQNTIELKNQNNVAGLSYLWGRYGGKFPVYTANISATHGINDTSGEFYLNLRKKLLYLDLNMTKDGTQSLHVHGLIPDARSAVFDIWRDYDDIRVSDISYYLRLNHSRLITSSLLWRRDVVSDVQSGIRDNVQMFYSDSLKAINESQQYVIAETMQAIQDIWYDAKPIVHEYLSDLRNLSVIADDFEEFKKFLNQSYYNNEFYIKDIATVFNVLFDELSLKSHLSSLPKIVQEIWQVMGSSAEKINKGIRWVMEKLKTYYKNSADFIHNLINGDPFQLLTDALKQLVEKYDEYIKNMHVSLVKYMEQLWDDTYSLIVDNWHKTLAALEPTFLKIIHYLETIVWNTSKEFLDFLYIRKSEIIGNPYFAKFSNFTQDLDKFYKDITGNNTISSIYKYAKIAWNFLKEKYLKNVPFAKEVTEIINEIVSEISELKNIPSILYLTQKFNESYDFLRYYYDYFVLESSLHNFLTTIYVKLTDKTPTALEMDNTLREAKTKFIFDPNEGVMLLEQKLPMSWHAFNETPIFQEIPEIKSLYELKNYFATSTLSFWNFYNHYRQYTNPEDWLPPFKGQAMLIGNKYYVTFDRKYYDFQGGCTYLLATDFRDRNFTLLTTYNDDENTNEFILVVNKTLVRIDVFKDTVKIGNTDRSSFLPVDIGQASIYRVADIVIVKSPLGFSFECNTKFQICTLELSGWYFGKTAGLLGTLNNEPSDDLTMSNKLKANTSTLNLFANSWSLKKNRCSTRNLKLKYKNKTPAEIAALCDEFYQSQVSDLTNCFSKVPKEPFMQMCLNSTTKQEACRSAVAYIKLCEFQDTPLRIPDTCVKCSLTNGTLLDEGVNIRLKDHEVPQSADIVFIIEAKKCNNQINRVKNIDILVESLNKELVDKKLTDNRFAVVVFGGSGIYSEPRSITLNGKTFDTPNNIIKYFENIPVGNGSTDIFEAILYAKELIFRPGVSKSFILFPCSKCVEHKMMYDYSTVQFSLFESAIPLHILMHAEFVQPKDRDNKIFGVDSDTAYTRKDIRELEGDVSLRKGVNLPKSILGICASLSLETKGSVFSSKNLVSDKRNAKKLSTVFAKRVAQSAIPKSCLDCECSASNSGVSYMECYSCTARINIEHGFEDDGSF